MLFLTPLSVAFFIIYGICVISDILDGYIARKINGCTKFGEVLDSIADVIFFIVIIVIFCLLKAIDNTIIYWVIGIAMIRILSLGVGFIKYKTIAFLHTYSNKFTGGIILFSFPMIFVLGGVTKTIVFLCIVATISSIEELLINLISKKLNRNIRGILDLKGNL